MLFDLYFNSSCRNEFDLDYSKYIHVKDEKEMSLLMYSLQVLRTTEHVKQLIELGADPNETDVYDKSILGELRWRFFYVSRTHCLNTC